MSRTHRRLSAAVAVLATGLLLGLGAAQAAARAAAPDNKAAPTVTGTATENQTLTALNGTWDASPAPRFSYGWERCDANVANCAAIAGATAQTYKLVAADIGHTVRVNVKASNRLGDSSAASSATALVASSQTRTTVTIDEVKLPARLVVDQFASTPNPVRSKASTITTRFHVSDTTGRSVSGALVYMVGVPSNRIPVPAEQATGADGWVQFEYQPLAKFPIVRGGSQVIFVRARAPHDDVLAGVSTRRLVQFQVSTP